MLHDILDDDHIQWHPTLMRYYTNFDPLLISTLLPILTSIEHLQRGDMPTEDAYSSGHLVLSHIGTFKCSNVETNLSWTCLVSGLLSFEHPSILLFCFHVCTLDSAWSARVSYKTLNHLDKYNFLDMRPMTDAQKLTFLSLLNRLIYGIAWLDQTLCD